MAHVDDATGIVQDDHVAARLADGSGAIYLVTADPIGNVVIVEDDLVEAESGEFGEPAVGVGAFATPTSRYDLGQFPFDSPGWDAMYRRDQEIVDQNISAFGTTGATGADGTDGTEGTDGATGTDGAEGITGPTGPGTYVMDKFTATVGQTAFTLSGTPTNPADTMLMFGFGALVYWDTMGATPYFTIVGDTLTWLDAAPPGAFVGSEPVVIVWQ